MSNQLNIQTLRICHVAMGDLWAGAEVQLATLVAELVRQADLELSVVLFNEGRLAEQLRAMSVSVSVFPEETWGTPRLLRELTMHCRKGRFDILHTHKYKDNILGVMAAVRTSVPCVVRTVHGLSEPFCGVQAIRMMVNELVDDWAIRFRVDRLIAVSSEIEATLRARYGEDKVVQIYNGIRLQEVQRAGEPLETRKRIGVDVTCRLIGTVGRLTAVKGQDDFLTCAHELVKRRKDVHFLLVGDGPLRERLEARTKELGLSERVTFLGHRDDTYDLIRSMDIFVLPSLHEGIPMVLLEAMALARPIVATRVGGIPEVVTDRVHGLLVAGGNPVELVDACERFLNDPDIAGSCAQAGQRRAEREFSSARMGAKVAALYREALRDR